MEKRISYNTFMSAKRIAQAGNTFYAKRNRLEKQLEKLKQEYNDCDAQISLYEAGIKQLTGVRVEDLVKKVIEPVIKDGVPALDKEGKSLKVTKYVPTDNVVYDKEHKQYIITLPDEVLPKAPSEKDLAPDPALV